ncbi:TonB-dependent receptor plug domain-containing protein [Roseateles chitinivorans]|uniref:TonB-dependent receptor plug domain-containing protein n=1 Tax=Roseateles chitinivorans TaxID=2917965 RepID=UPI003D664CF8
MPKTYFAAPSFSSTAIAVGALLVSQGQALAQARPAAATLERVEVDGAAATDTQRRRDFVAGKIVISRRTIEDSGQTSVQDLLKREPSVTIGANGQLGLLGLPGYTQVLIDGKPPLPGRSPMETDLVHVERIEIVKGSLAEFGPFGIAGTINIVSRRVDRKPSAAVRLGGVLGPAVADANVAWSDTWRPPEASWTLSSRLLAAQAG